ncbi:MAG: HEPN domain-containing protein [bacterium]
MNTSAEADSLIRRARIKVHDMKDRIERGDIGHIIPDAYNVMFMAAKAALMKRGFEVASHRTVVATYRKEFIDKRLISPDFEGHLSKIQAYWEKEGTTEAEVIDTARASRIVDATFKLVEALAETMKAGSEEPFRIK